MTEQQAMLRSAVEKDRLYRRFRSERCAVEVADIQARPIDGVQFVTVTTRSLENGKDVPVLEFDIKKYNACLTVLLPKKYPFVAPVVTFDPYKNIPKHPDVDDEMGRVHGFWSKEGEWKRETKIRDICASVMTMLAESNTPEAPPPMQQSGIEDQLQFITTRREFDFLCKNGADFVQGLRTRYSCMIKFRFKNKKLPSEAPQLLIISKLKTTRETVAAALDDYLVRERVRRVPKFKKVDPEPDANAFVSFFQTPSGAVSRAEDLISFDHGENQPFVYHYSSHDDVPFVQEYSDVELIQEAGNVKAFVQEMALNEWCEMQSVVQAVNTVSSKMHTTETDLANPKALLDRTKKMVAVQRGQFNELSFKLRELEHSSFRYQCQVCLRRPIDTLLDCSHCLCRFCAEQNQCIRCHRQVESKLALYF